MTQKRSRTRMTKTGLFAVMGRGPFWRMGAELCGGVRAAQATLDVGAGRFAKVLRGGSERQSSDGPVESSLLPDLPTMSTPTGPSLAICSDQFERRSRFACQHVGT